MALIIHLESATESCSACLAEDGEVLATVEEVGQNIHGTKLSGFIESCLEQAGREMADLEAVAVSSGPGSYTGLRIGTSLAKGICYALGIPLISIDTLSAMAAGISKTSPGYDIYCPMIDARRSEVYTTLIAKDNTTLLKTCALIIDHSSFSEHLKDSRVLFFGSGAGKCIELIEHPNGDFNTNFINSGAHLVPLAIAKHNNREFEDLAYYEPYYLKEFISRNL